MKWLLLLILSLPISADDIVAGISFDANWGQRSFGDKRGDVKNIFAVQRFDDFVITFDTGIFTGPQPNQFDTGNVSIYGGNEHNNLSFYIGADFYNGFVLNATQEIVRFTHSLISKDTRISPASNEFKINPGIKVRYDYQYRLIRSIVFGKVSLTDNYAGIGAFIGIKPNLPDMPMLSRSETGFYAGVTTRYMFSDIRQIDKKHIGLHVGGIVKLSDRTALEVRFDKPRYAVEQLYFGFSLKY